MVSFYYCCLSVSSFFPQGEIFHEKQKIYSVGLCNERSYFLLSCNFHYIEDGHDWIVHFSANGCFGADISNFLASCKNIMTSNIV